MLKPAILYKNEVEYKINETWFQEKYKYWNNGVFFESLNIVPNTWESHQFVSVKESTDEVIGYISYGIVRCEDYVSGISIINFTDDNKFIFGMDVGKALKDIFEKFNFRKISFSVVVGNPIEKTYDKLIKKYGGRIIGIKKEETRLMDNRYYNLKLYEILKYEYDYIKNKR